MRKKITFLKMTGHNEQEKRQKEDKKGKRKGKKKGKKKKKRLFLLHLFPIILYLPAILPGIPRDLVCIPGGVLEEGTR
jgi:hypothetical protein